MVRQNLEQWHRKIKRWTDRFPNAVYKAYIAAGPVIVEDVKKNRLSGQVLNAVSGNLRSSIQFKAKAKPRPSLEIGTDVNYGAIWMSRGRDFLRPSIRAKMKKVEEFIVDEIMKEYKAQ